MSQINNLPIEVLRKFFASAYGWTERGDVSQIALATPVTGTSAPDGTTKKTSPEWRSKNAKAAAEARHSKPGGSREKKAQMRELWASGRYTSRDRCAEEECGALSMSFSAARKALRGTPDPY